MNEGLMSALLPDFTKEPCFAPTACHMDLSENTGTKLQVSVL